MYAYWKRGENRKGTTNKEGKRHKGEMAIQLNIKEGFGLLLHVASRQQILFFVHCFFIHIQSFTYQKYFYLVPTVLCAWCQGDRERLHYLCEQGDDWYVCNRKIIISSKLCIQKSDVTISIFYLFLCVFPLECWFQWNADFKYLFLNIFL